MTRARSSNDLDALDGKAIGWVVRLTSCEATAADIEAFQRWRRRSPMHEQAFADAARLWRIVRAAACASRPADPDRP